MNYQELIVKIIDVHNGLKSGDLSLAIMARINPVRFNNEEYLSALQGLIEDGIICQFSYENASHGIYVMYFPKGTKFLVGK